MRTHSGLVADYHARLRKANCPEARRKANAEQRRVRAENIKTNREARKKFRQSRPIFE